MRSTHLIQTLLNSGNTIEENELIWSILPSYRYMGFILRFHTKHKVVYEFQWLLVPQVLQQFFFSGLYGSRKCVTTYDCPS